MPHLQVVIVDDDALDQQLQDHLLLLERSRVNASPDALTEGRQVGEHRLGLRPFLPQLGLLRLLLLHRLLPPRQLPSAVGQFLQREDAHLVRIDQAPVFLPQPLSLRRQSARLGLVTPIALRRRRRGLLELGHEPLWLRQQCSDVGPDGGFQFGGVHRPSGADAVTGAEDRILAAALVIASLRLAGGRRVGDAVHRQPAAAAAQQAAQEVRVLLIAPEGPRRVAGELGLRLLGGRLVDDRRDRDSDPVGLGIEAPTTRLAAARSGWAARPSGGHVVVSVGVGGPRIDGVAEDMVDHRGRPARFARARSPRAGVESLEELADGQVLVDQPVVERADQFGFGGVDDQMAGGALLLGHVPIAVGGDVRDVLAGAGLVQLAAAESLPEHSPLVFGDSGLDLEQQLVVGVVADGMLDEDDVHADPAQFVEDQRLVGVLAGEPVGGEDGDDLEQAGLGVVAQAVEGGAVEAGATVAAVAVGVLLGQLVAVLGDPSFMRVANLVG